MRTVTLKEPRKIAGVERKAGEVLDLHDDLAGRLVLAGLAVYGRATPEGDDATTADTDLESMTVAELKALAQARGVDLGSAKEKAEIIEAIRELQG